MSTHLQMLREFLPRRMVEHDLRNLDVLFGEMARWPVLDLLASDVFRGIELALVGRRDLKMPENWPDVATKLAASRTEEARDHGLRLGVLFGDPKALEGVRKLVRDS